ncbi:MAG TPA: ATP-binding protein [Chryseosolibacter sp.]|nr:ATP-binding protein [Chryseosolibacter sp.]
MKEIVQVQLDNEMDLILAHKRTMKLCELTGFSLIVQTSVATAVSEIARCAIEHGKGAHLALGIELTPGKKFLKAVISDPADFSRKCAEACAYAKRLVSDIEVISSPREIQVVMKQQLSFAGTLTDAKLDSFINYFKQEPPLSAYDELRRKNLLLQELSEKLKESENHYRVLTDSLPLMMFSVNSRGMISYANKWLEKFLGVIPKDLNSDSWKSFVHAEDLGRFSKDLKAALQRQATWNGKYRFREKSTGNFLWHLISVNPLRNETEIVYRWIGFIVDVDAEVQIEQTRKDNRELKEIQRQLFNQQAELQQKIVELNRSNYELEQFAHLASHDLQEPLRKLLFYSDVLKNRYHQTIDAPGANMLNNMTLAASRMKELINDLLSYSQLQQQKLAFDRVDLNDVMDEITREVDLTIKEKNAIVEVAHLPTIEGNFLRLRQLFSNLISNALKYSKNDTPPEIKVTCLASDDNVSICVKDNGIGFDDMFSEKIFGLFERLHTRDKIPGTGIGLSICKRIAELHNGTIAARSVPNEYAVFEVTLPLRQQNNEPGFEISHE